MSYIFWSWMGCAFPFLISGKTTSHEVPFRGKHAESRRGERLWWVKTLKRLLSNTKLWGMIAERSPVWAHHNECDPQKEKKNYIWSGFFLSNSKPPKHTIFTVLCCSGDNYCHTRPKVLNISCSSCYLCDRIQMPGKIYQAGGILLSVSHPKKRVESRLNPAVFWVLCSVVRWRWNSCRCAA